MADGQVQIIDQHFQLRQRWRPESFFIFTENTLPDANRLSTLLYTPVCREAGIPDQHPDFFGANCDQRLCIHKSSEIPGSEVNVSGAPGSSLTSYVPDYSRGNRDYRLGWRLIPPGGINTSAPSLNPAASSRGVKIGRIPVAFSSPRILPCS